MTRPTWPHLENLDRVLKEYDPDFLQHERGTDTIVVTEKLHGFNARFGRDEDDVLWVGSRNQVVYDGDPTAWPRDALQGFVGFAADHADKLDKGETLFGEWAGKGIQKGIDYGERDFYSFGLMKNGQLQPFGRMMTVAEDYLGCKTVPVLGVFSYYPLSLDWLTEARDAKSRIAEQVREGVVIYRWPVPTDVYGNPVIAKFKSARFNEVARAPKAAKELPDMEAAMHLVREYATPQRLEHVLQQVDEVCEPGYTALDVQLTGQVMRAMYEDIVREAGSEYEALSDESKKSFGKVLNPTTKRLLDDARMQAAVAA